MLRPARHRFLALLFATLATGLLLATPADAARKRTLLARPADAVEVFSCGFDDENWDINYDRWPDRWTRREGLGYPHYVEMEIVEDPSTKSGRKLRVLLDGAQAEVSSPPVRVMPKFSYSLEIKVKVDKAPRSRVWIRFDYMNAAGEVRQTQRSEPIASDTGWTTIQLGPTRPRFDDVDRAVIRLETERGDRGDLDGEVSIADLWLGRNPSLEVTANNPFHVYTNPEDVVITCSLSGIRERDPEIRFQLLDATNRHLGGVGVKRLDGREIIEQKLIREESRRASDIVDGMGNHAVGFEGAEEWRPHIERLDKKFGFFQVQVQMLSSETGQEMDHKTITLAVIPPAIDKSRGNFGWTLPTADEPLPFQTLEKVLPLVGVNWVKLPIWFPQDNPDRGEEIIQFAERLAANDIETIGIIQHPELLTRNPEEDTVALELYDVANVFGGDSSRWLPLYDHIMTRLSLRIRWWQLGADGDTSFVGYADLVNQIADIRHKLYRFGQDVGLGLGWRWDTPMLQQPSSWEFHQMASNPPLNSEQLDERLASNTTTSSQRWVLIEPNIDETAYATDDERHVARVRELVKQIVIAKQHGADGIFVPNPFSGSHGVMTPEGKPGELLLPWRTSATLLGGSTYLGQLQLPMGSKNWLFLRPDGRVVMVAWNDHAVTEVLHLGDEISVVDVWGQETTPGRIEHRDAITVGPMPRFVLGLNEAIARWRMSVKFEHERVPSVFALEHPNALLLRNGFPQGVGGRMQIFVPDLLTTSPSGEPKASDNWKVSASGDDFGIAAGKRLRIPIEIELSDAAIGAQPIRIDFEVEADRAEEGYRFSVWRSLEVGLGDVRIDVHSELDDRGRLVVRQHMVNTSGTPMNFKCFLHAKNRRRKRAQVFELGPDGDTKEYTYPRGEELIGTDIKLRVEEIDGTRVLIQRLVAEE